MAAEERTEDFEIAKSSWLLALYEGDCLKIQELLSLHPHPQAPSRVSSDFPSRLVVIHPRSNDGRNEFENKFSDWKGCSALHVAVKRGWPWLVQKIVHMFSNHELTSGSKTSTGDAITLDHHRLQELLLSVDGDYGLDALALAVVNRNETIVKLLAKASFLCGGNLYGITTDEISNSTESGAYWSTREVTVNCTGFDPESYTAEGDEILKDKLGKITREALGKLPDRLGIRIKEIYGGNRAYNFLPWEQFLFHFSFVDSIHRTDREYLNRWRIDMISEFRHNEDNEMVKYLFNLKDGTGRTPAHVLTGGNAYADEVERDFLRWLRIDEVHQFLDVRDGAGRPFLFHAGSTALTLIDRALRAHFTTLLETKNYGLSKYEIVNAGMFRYSFNLGALCTRNGYAGHRFRDLKEGEVIQSATWIHNALIRNELDPILLQLVMDRMNDPTLCIWDQDAIFRLDENKIILGDRCEDPAASWSTLEVAALCGNTKVFKYLFERNNGSSLDLAGLDHNMSDPSASRRSANHGLSILHIAAIIGDPAMIQAILSSGKFDPLTPTARGQNTALHFATYADHSEPVLTPSLLDLVNVSHRGTHLPDVHPFKDSIKKREKARFTYDHDKQFHPYAFRGTDSAQMGCILLLLQAGINIWGTNRYGNMPTLGEQTSVNLGSWWYEKLTKETQEAKASLNSAANAISVTAALVATASFVGPLQPPLNYDTGSSGLPRIYTDSQPVTIFMVCNTLALYLALVAIMFSVMPLLPLAQESLLDELSYVRKNVIFAVCSLIPSIILFLLGFAAASVAVTSIDSTMDSGGLTMMSILIGGLYGIFLIYLFCLRLIRLILPRNIWLRRNYRRLTLLFK